MKSTSDEGGRNFGNRQLVDPNQVFEHNAWDNMEWTEEQENEARCRVQTNGVTKVDPLRAQSLESNAGTHWHEFYDKHQTKFFKDRNWLFKEFPQLLIPNQTILEVGCGAGNTIFPLLQNAQETNSNVFVYACDFAENVVQLVKKHDLYSTGCHAFVCDVSASPLQMPIPLESLDVIVMIFVLSAINPSKMQSTINGLTKYLKRGGQLLFRDYAKYDLAQLRFKDGQCISDNFYVRQDNTRVYFFTQDELDEMFVAAGLKKIMNYADRRLLVNRHKKITMSRIWLQCQYEKI